MKIFIVEDDAAIAGAMARHIESWGCETRIVSDFRNVLGEFMDYQPQLVLMDVGLPFFNGYHWCSQIRRFSKVPIIFISSASDNMNIVMAVNMGADDYITKPFTPMELLARVNSHLRRYHRFMDRLHSRAEESARIYRAGGLEVNEDTVSVTIDDRTKKVTPIEFKILLLLIRNPGRVFPADEIYERVWNERAINTDTVMVHIRNLREKIEVNPKEPKYLKVVWGVGYKIEKQL